MWINTSTPNWICAYNSEQSFFINICSICQEEWKQCISFNEIVIILKHIYIIISHGFSERYILIVKKWSDHSESYIKSFYYLLSVFILLPLSQLQKSLVLVNWAPRTPDLWEEHFHNVCSWCLKKGQDWGRIYLILMTVPPKK